MALQQLDAIQLGPFSPGVYAQVGQIFSSITPPSAWSSSTNYIANQCVEFGGGVWRALGASLNQTPASGSAYWILILPTVKDGDVALVISGTASDINIRQNSVWVSVLGIPFSVSLPNNTSGTVATFPSSVARAGTIDYSIVNNGIYEAGTLRYESDGVNAYLVNSNVVQLDGSPGISFSAAVSGSNVVLSYTSTNPSGSPATMKYKLTGWT